VIDDVSIVEGETAGIAGADEVATSNAKIAGTVAFNTG